MGVEVGQCLGHVQGDVDLKVEGERWRIFRPHQEACQALVHQLHKQDGLHGVRVATHTEVLDEVGVSHFCEELTPCQSAR